MKDDDRLIAARAAIAEIDREMAALFLRRMAAAADIAAYKKEKGLPVLDEDQERRVVERNLTYVGEGPLKIWYRRFITDMMDISKAYQRVLIRGEAHSGEEET